MKLNQELSYKEICKEFNDEIFANSRKRQCQLNRWNKIAKVEKVGRGKYIIKRLLSQQEIQDNEDKNNYSRFLQSMLLKLFSKQETNLKTYTYRELREYLNMVNRHYFPVKYGKEDIELKASCTVNIQDIIEDENADNFSLVLQERNWFHIADTHDKDALKYAIKALKDRGLIVDYRFTYVFYKKQDGVNGDEIFSKPVTATDEQFAEVHQRNMEFLKKHLTKKQIEEINRATPEDKIFGHYQQAVFRQGEEARKEYGDIPRQYATEIGYTGYAKAITILKPTRLENLIESFGPKFNAVQVQRYLGSKRFKEIPYSLHEQLTDKLIKQ